MIRNGISLIFLLVLSIGSKAQLSEALTFSERSYDFGRIKEVDGPVIHEFGFINNGGDTVQISNVKASCGCTTPAWTRQPVPPGQSGIIQAQYNPKNRPGAFNKNLTVTLKSSTEPVRLFIKGYVEPVPKSVEEEFPAQIGAIRTKYRAFNFGKIKVTNDPVVKEFDLVNASDSMVIFSDSIAKPSHITVQYAPQLLKPKQRGKIILTYDASALNELGFRNDNVTLYSSEAGDVSIKSYSVYATLEEYFPPMSQEELERAPKLSMTKTVHDFGKVKNMGKLKTTFNLFNSGKTPLSIRYLKPNCSCVITGLDNDVIPAGESVRLDVIFDPNGRRGNQQKSVAIFSNDPRASAQRVTIKAYVESDKDI
ncbi:MAG: DUF1573 domain-containing protein [Bacteroidota bacterium]